MTDESRRLGSGAWFRLRAQAPHRHDDIVSRFRMLLGRPETRAEGDAAARVILFDRETDALYVSPGCYPKCWWLIRELDGSVCSEPRKPNLEIAYGPKS